MGQRRRDLRGCSNLPVLLINVAGEWRGFHRKGKTRSLLPRNQASSRAFQVRTPRAFAAPEISFRGLQGGRYPASRAGFRTAAIGTFIARERVADGGRVR